MWTLRRVGEPVPFKGMLNTLIAYGRVFIAANDRGTLQVTALDVRSGRRLWTQPVPGTHAADPRLSAVPDALVVTDLIDEPSQSSPQRDQMTVLDAATGVTGGSMSFPTPMATAPSRPSRGLHVGSRVHGGRRFGRDSRARLAYRTDTVDAARQRTPDDGDRIPYERQRGPADRWAGPRNGAYHSGPLHLWTFDPATGAVVDLGGLTVVSLPYVVGEHRLLAVTANGVELFAYEK